MAVVKLVIRADGVNLSHYSKLLQSSIVLNAIFTSLMVVNPAGCFNKMCPIYCLIFKSREL